MKCKDCNYFKYNYKNKGTCYHPDVPLLIVKRDMECKFEVTKLRCSMCKYWLPAEGFKREDDCGGCTFGGGFYPMFLREPCNLKEEYRVQVEKEHSEFV
jgi:hypothetical protein